MIATKEKLVEIAREKSLLPFHGLVNEIPSNLEPIIKYFPKWNIIDADKLWCAAFVYYCCREAGFEIPYSPIECKTCSLAGCGGWEEFALGDKRIEYHKRNVTFIPSSGDIVIYDNIFCNQKHDHMGIVLEVKDNKIVVAEGNIPYSNKSGIVERPIDDHIRAYIRIPDKYKYQKFHFL